MTDDTHGLGDRLKVSVTYPTMEEVMAKQSIAYLQSVAQLTAIEKQINALQVRLDKAEQQQRETLLKLAQIGVNLASLADTVEMLIGDSK